MKISTWSPSSGNFWLYSLNVPVDFKKPTNSLILSYCRLDVTWKLHIEQIELAYSYVTKCIQSNRMNSCNIWINSNISKTKTKTCIHTANWIKNFTVLKWLSGRDMRIMGFLKPVFFILGINWKRVISIYISACVSQPPRQNFCEELEIFPENTVERFHSLSSTTFIILD